MSSTAVASAPVASVPGPKTAKATKPKIVVKALHPSYLDMITKAIGELKGKTGSSKPAILKYVLANFQVGDNIIQVNAHLRLALKRGVVKGDFKQVKGTGASGSFKLGEKKPTPKIVKKVIAKKPAAKKTKPVKPATEKKAKSPKKVAAKSKSEKSEKTEKKAKAAVSTKDKKVKSTKKAAPKPKTEKKAKAPKKAAAKPKAKKVTEPKA